jgi:hypothetical protein
MASGVLATFEVAASYALIAGGLGTAAFGIVDALLKSTAPIFKALGATPVREAGFKKLQALWSHDTGLAGPLTDILGNQFEEQLRQLYVEGELEGQVREILGYAFDMSLATGGAVKDVNTGSHGGALKTQFHDFRLRAAISSAKDVYKNNTRALASTIAMALSLLGYVNQNPQWPINWDGLFIWIFLGIVAVPIAPMAKDVASRLSEGSRVSKTPI